MERVPGGARSLHWPYRAPPSWRSGRAPPPILPPSRPPPLAPSPARPSPRRARAGAGAGAGVRAQAPRSGRREGRGVRRPAARRSPRKTQAPARLPGAKGSRELCRRAPAARFHRAQSEVNPGGERAHRRYSSAHTCVWNLGRTRRRRTGAAGSWATGPGELGEPGREATRRTMYREQ